MALNLLTLSSNNTAKLQVLGYDENKKWRIKDELPLFESSDARRFRLLRSSKDLKGEIDSQVTKYVEFTRERDIRIQWIFTNWYLDKPIFDRVVENSTGRPTNPLLRFTSDFGSTDLRVDFAKHDADHAWYIGGDVPGQYRKIPIRIDLSYEWNAGGILTAEEMKVITESSAPGQIRREGVEFSAIQVDGAVYSAQLMVVIPPDFSPEDEPKVRVFDDDRKPHMQEAEELQRLLMTLGPGRYSLTIPYPREKWLYALTWRPLSESALPKKSRLVPDATKDGRSLLSAFRRNLDIAFLKESPRLSLFVRSDENVRLRIAHMEPNETILDNSALPQTLIVGTQQYSVVGQAFWGMPAHSKRPPDESLAAILGFLPDEKALIAIPISFALGWANPAPWGVVRLGLRSGNAEEVLAQIDRLDQVLTHATMHMLTTAH